MSITPQIFHNTTRKNKRRTTQSFKYLPKDWRVRVCQMLEEDGIVIKPQIITNLRNGHTLNNELLKKVTSKMEIINQKRKAEVVESKALTGR